MNITDDHIGTMVYTYHDALGDEITETACYGLDNRKASYNFKLLTIRCDIETTITILHN